ncbi:U11/U12 small nuclear ribonucleoprotein 48 kDa protein isoform X1 [Typha angustifolia]|uniref:U11/U12 small nuclear ribonucleoprotein 48 kDa protein isoform X1 n=1 Tax=Typha angustifolia TaxID=59011 RepID=UPI003C2C62F4
MFRPMEPSFSSLHLSSIPLPLPQTSTTFLPNPNPSPNPIPAPSATDLPTAISLLKDLISVAETALKSTADFLSLSSDSTAGFCTCPYDSRHRMPPESLFRHSLLCPSAPGAARLDLGLLETLRYPTSLKPESEIRKETQIFLPPADLDADLCFSLDDAELGDLGSNFFYKDCPGVVTTPEPDISSRTFTLPGFLSIECGNFIPDHGGGDGDLGGGLIRILPSEFWALRCEVEAWRDFPVSYSYVVLQVALSLNRVEEGDLKKWVLMNSPKNGILIDVAMRDHIYLLLKLCLKAIAREACVFLKLTLNKDGLFDSKFLRFECPRLVGSLSWFASQLSVLYGEANGKLFALGMLKESIVQAGSRLLLINYGEDGCMPRDGNKVTGEDCDFRDFKQIGDVEHAKPSKKVSRRQVLVSQVAAAVAALHERSLLEEKIKALRFAQPLSKAQLLMEHSHASTRGSEERGKRSNYRPILEHDGLLPHRVQNQDSGKAKTREELLAEERDYKRRRMSYRGKKVKRNPTQVIRDIIEDHMEEIKQAGGIGCHVKIAEDIAPKPFKYNYERDNISDIHELRDGRYDPFDTVRSSPGYSKSINAVVSKRDTSENHDMPRSLWKSRYDHCEHQEEHDRNEPEGRKIYTSRSSISHRSYSHTYEQDTHKEQNKVTTLRSRHERSDSDSHSRSEDHKSRSSLTPKSYKKGYSYASRGENEEKARACESHRSESVTQSAFEDRYNPTGSYDEYDSSYDSSSVGSYCVRSHKSDNLRKNEIYSDELRRTDNSTRRHKRDHQEK